MVAITTDPGKREAMGVKGREYMLASPLEAYFLLLCCAAPKEKSIHPTELTSAIRGSTIQNIGVAIT